MESRINIDGGFCLAGCYGGDVFQLFGVDDNIASGDPVEIFGFFNFSNEPKDVDITIQRFAGPAPNIVKYVVFDPLTINEWDTKSGASYGKAMANGAFGTGASIWFNTQAYNPSCKGCARDPEQAECHGPGRDGHDLLRLQDPVQGAEG